MAIARRFFQPDPKISIICMDGAVWIKQNIDSKLDLIFADAWPGKYNALDETLAMLKIGGFYIVDDMLQQANWPDGHAEKAQEVS